MLFLKKISETYNNVDKFMKDNTNNEPIYEIERLFYDRTECDITITFKNQSR